MMVTCYLAGKLTRKLRNTHSKERNQFLEKTRDKTKSNDFPMKTFGDIGPKFKFDFERDILVFLEIQKTGSTLMNR